jgi:hypothetical protein
VAEEQEQVPASIVVGEAVTTSVSRVVLVSGRTELLLLVAVREHQRTVQRRLRTLPVPAAQVEAVPSQDRLSLTAVAEVAVVSGVAAVLAVLEAAEQGVAVEQVLRERRTSAVVEVVAATTPLAATEDRASSDSATPPTTRSPHPG